MEKPDKIKTSLVFLPNPFCPSEREEYDLEVGSTLIQWLQDKYPKGIPFPYTITRNNIVLELDNLDTVIQEGDTYHLLVKLEDPVTIAVTVAVSILTTVIASELVKEDTPDNPSSFLPQELQPSPSYNSRSQSNTVRKNEPIPVQYGKFRQFPDLATRPWFEYSDNNEILHQLFCLGQGEFDIDRIQIGDNDIIGVSDIQSTIFGPFDTVNAFHNNMLTSDAVKNKSLYPVTSYGSLGPFRCDKNMCELRNTSNIPIPLDSIFSVGDTVSFDVGGVVTGTDRLYLGFYTVVSTGVDFVTVDPSECSSWPVNISNFGVTARLELVDYPVPSEISFDSFQAQITGSSFSTSTSSRSRPIISSPVGNITDTFYLDIDFPQALYNNIDPSEPAVAQYQVRCYEIDDNNEYKFDPITTETFIRENSPGSAKFYSSSLRRYANFSTGDLFYIDGATLTPIPPGDIIQIYDGQYPSESQFVTLTAIPSAPFDPNFIVWQGSSGRNYTPYFENGIGDDLSIFLRVTSSSNVRIRKTIRVKTSYAARWKLKVTRTDTEVYNTTSQISTLKRIRSELVNQQYFGPFTFVAISITSVRANNDIINSNKFNVFATRKLPTWNGVSFDAPVATQSIARAITDAWMSSYGGSRSFDDIDLDGLLALDAIWSARGDTFNGVFDQKITVWEAIKKIARAGRAIPYFDGNKLFIVRDEIKPIRTALFTPNSITDNSLTINYRFQSNQDPNGFIMKYLDEDLNYQEAEVVSNVNADRRKESKFFGVTNYNQVWKESQYLDSVQRLRKKTVRFKAEMSGLLLRPYDRIGLTHDILPEFGQYGYVTNFVPFNQLTVDRNLDFSGAGPWYMIFSREDGSVSGPWEVTAGASSNQANFQAPFPTGITFLTELGSTLRTAYAFGEGAQYTMDLLVTTVTPNDAYTSTIESVTYDEAVYTADTGIIPPKPVITPSATPIPPKLSGLKLTNVPDSGNVTATWNPAFGITNYVVETSTDFSIWVNVGSPVINTFTFPIVGFTYVRVAAVITPLIGEYASSNIQAITT